MTFNYAPWSLILTTHNGESFMWVNGLFTWVSFWCFLLKLFNFLIRLSWFTFSWAMNWDETFLTNTVRCCDRVITWGIIVGRVAVSDVSLISCPFEVKEFISFLIWWFTRNWPIVMGLLIGYYDLNWMTCI
jgi:hypothetical protein